MFLVIYLEKYLIQPVKNVGGHVDVEESSNTPEILGIAMRSAWIQVAAIAYMQANGTQFLPFADRYTLSDILYAKFQESLESSGNNGFFEYLQKTAGDLGDNLANIFHKIGSAGHQSIETLGEQAVVILNGEEVEVPVQPIPNAIPHYHVKYSNYETEATLIHLNHGSTVSDHDIESKNVHDTSTDTSEYEVVGRILALNDAVTVTENQGVVIPVKLNDTDESGDATISSVSQPGHGSVVINGDGTIHYTPNNGFVGTDTFTYTLSNGNLHSTATVTVTVTGILPQATNDAAVTNEDHAVLISVLTNDVGNDLRVTNVGIPGHGIVVINADNTLTYTPVHNFTGTDTFTYVVTDSFGVLSTATVSVVVNPIPPQATNDSIIIPENHTVLIPVLSNDNGDDLSIVSVSDPGHGTVMINGDNTLSYTPANDFTGTDTFTYTIKDSRGATSTAQVSIQVTDTLRAVNDTAVTNENQTVVIPVKLNDIDSGNDAVIISTGRPDHGTAVINNDGTISYTPDHGFAGTDVFIYTLKDDDRTSTAFITVTVKGTLPHATDDSIIIPENHAVLIPILNNDIGDSLHITGTSAPAHGTLIINSDDTVIYTPTNNFTGTDHFNYTIMDSHGGSSTGQVTIQVTDVLRALNDTATTTVGHTVVIPVKDNDIDFGRDGVISHTSHPGHGDVTINVDGTISYTPNNGFIGHDVFTYTLSDDGLHSNATVTVDVTGVNSVNMSNNHVLTGGVGSDLFVLSVKDTGRDEIKNFTIGEDHIKLNDVVDIRQDIINVHDDGRDVTLNFHDGGAVVIENIGGHHYNSLNALIDHGIIIQPVTP